MNSILKNLLIAFCISSCMFIFDYLVIKHIPILFIQFILLPSILLVKIFKLYTYKIKQLFFLLVNLCFFDNVLSTFNYFEFNTFDTIIAKKIFAIRLEFTLLYIIFIVLSKTIWLKKSFKLMYTKIKQSRLAAK
ncbi:MAG TPA: hypothetical protein DCG28_02715 [Lachnospiraceae bacterium]|nr:hypothetical protein [Lachnospiraceae bacterium]